MIQPTELRLNNWVYSIQLAKEVQISSIQEDSVTFAGEVTWDYNTEEMIEPIPLSEEVLLKCGFIARGNVFFKEDIGSLYFKKPFKESDYFLVKSNGGDKITSLKYLHQLQNLYFALTNQELNYKP